jgi:glutathione peroxidase-family protein
MPVIKSSPSPIMRTQQSLIIKSNIPEIKRICKVRGIDYEIQLPKKSKVKISEQELKAAYQKLAKSKNYEKEMKE